MHRSGPPSLRDEARADESHSAQQQPWRPSHVPDWKSSTSDEPKASEVPPSPPGLTPSAMLAAQALTVEHVLPQVNFTEHIDQSGEPGDSQELLTAMPCIPPPPLSSPPQPSDTAKPTRSSAVRSGEELEGFVTRFQQWRQQSGEFEEKIRWSFDQIATMETAHEKESSAYREAVNARLDQQQKLLDAAQIDLQRSQSIGKTLQDKLEQQSQRLTATEQECYRLRVLAAQLEQTTRYAEDRARIAEAGLGIAEAKRKQAEAAMEHISDYANAVQTKLNSAAADREEALQRQYSAFETDRKQLILFFDRREAALIALLNAAAESIYAKAQRASSEATATAVAHWKRLYDDLLLQYRGLEQMLAQRKAELEKEGLERRQSLELESARRQDALKAEMEALSDALRRREEALARTTSQRETEMQTREQKLREERAAYEASSAAAMRSREAELKRQHQAALEAAKAAYETERDRLLESFTDQLQKVSNMHLNNERELERLHREKEREMAQRYQQAARTLDERESAVSLQDVASRTQDALLMSFDSMESRQRARAEQLRTQLKQAASSEPFQQQP